MTNKYDRKIESCSPSSDLVAYLYGELTTADSAAFEEHLSDCERCTNEFAELSFARLDVYEWHRDEFAEMVTPQFVIPYEAVVAKISWLDALRGLWAVNPGWITVGGAFALFAVVFGAAMISSTMYDQVEVVTHERNNGPDQSPKSATKLSVPHSVQPAGAGTTVQTLSETKELEIVTAAVKRSKPVNNRVKAPVTRAGRDLKQMVPAQATKAPRLNDFEDEEDNTLRLGDLLADVDSDK